MVRGGPGPHHPAAGDRVPRLRQPVRAGGDARGAAHPRAGHDAGRRGHVRDQPRPAVHPADQQRRQPAPGGRVQHAVRGVLRRRGPRRRGPDVPVRRADRRVRQHQRDRDRHGRPAGRPGQGEAGRRGRRLQPVRHHRPPDGVDHPAPLRPDPGGRLRLRHRHGAPHPAGHPGRARFHRRRPAVAGHRAGRVRLRRTARPGWSRCSRTSAWPRSATATGFGLQVAGDLRTVPPPSASELAAVRSVDPLGVRTSEFSAAGAGPDLRARERRRTAHAERPGWPRGRVRARAGSPWSGRPTGPGRWAGCSGTTWPASPARCCRSARRPGSAARWPTPTCGTCPARWTWP